MKKTATKIIAWAALLLCLHATNSDAKVKIAPQDRTVMNGYSIDMFPDFQKDWHLVTSRYRKDTGEMRLTYANDLAWEYLLKNSKDYPDGAIFAKIGMATEEDPGFVSSAVPSGARRYQFMVRDHKKHESTSGWGYALFDAKGNVMSPEEDDMVKAEACNACHLMVPERGYVFSQPMNLEIATSGQITPVRDTAKESPLSRVLFETITRKDLPEALAKELPADFKTMSRVTAPFDKGIFEGTLDEIRPTLARQVTRTEMPAMLVAEDGKRFSSVYPVMPVKDCKTPDHRDGMEVKAYFTVPTKDGIHSNPFGSLQFCEAFEKAK